MDAEERQARLTALAQQLARVQVTSGGDAGRPDDERAGQPSADRETDRERARQAAAARAICLRLLAISPRPRAGLAQALERRDIPADVAAAVLDRFTDIGLIDDAAYARSFVRVKHRDRALGRAALRTELRRLGLAEEVMSEAVQAVDTDAERARAAELVDKRIDAAMAAGPVAARRRLLGLLDRRGYPAEVAVPVVESALRRYPEDVG